MSELALFAISSQRMQWLSARQSAIASNIANADTPGYRARDVAAFESYLEGARLDTKVTSAGHISSAPANGVDVKATERGRGEGKHSGNTVSLEHELIRSAQVKGSHALTVEVVGAFHQMMISAVRE
ncbi:MAG: flagellar basal body protein [Filomicrobium sp.]